MKRILIVDDESRILDAFARSLRSAGYDVTTAEDVQNARVWINTRRFDVVLTDYRMPGGTGLDVLRTARELQPAARRLLTSGTLDAEADRAKHSGLVEATLAKPFDTSELLTLIEG